MGRVGLDQAPSCADVLQIGQAVSRGAYLDTTMLLGIALSGRPRPRSAADQADVTTLALQRRQTILRATGYPTPSGTLRTGLNMSLELQERE